AVHVTLVQQIVLNVIIDPIDERPVRGDPLACSVNTPWGIFVSEPLAADPERLRTMKNAAPESQRKIANRLRRARGQLDAVIEAVENDGSCRDVVTQLSAVSTALDRAGFLIVSTAMKNCLDDPEAAATGDDPLTVDELEKLFLTLA